MRRHIRSTGAQEFEVLDVEALKADDWQSGIKRFTLNRKPNIVHCDVFIAGGGMGGVAAAIRAAQLGTRVCMTEETSWIGGQATSQGVSALDENYMVETSGAPRLYQDWRSALRQYYRTRPGVSTEAASNETLNPGNCWVTWLSFEPKVAVEKLNEIIAANVPPKSLDIALRRKVLSAKVSRGRIQSLLTVNLDDGTFTEYRPRFVLDATELGDLLPMAGVPYSSGAEAREETGEPHAPIAANPENVQDFVFPFVIEFHPNQNNCIAKPPGFDEFQNNGKFSFNGYKMFEQAAIPGTSQSYLPFWTYRRLIAKENYPNSSEFSTDLSMINWDSNDLRGENIIDKPLDVQAKRLALAKNLSYGFLYWLQHEAGRDEGGKGYPELKLRTDVLDTVDGLSKYPYIREARRIKAVDTIAEQDVAAATNDGARAKLWKDAVGIGLYPIDIHGDQDVPGAGQGSKPFQIPLGALVQTTIRNLAPACKNIGTTHVTNGAYRLHPVEWGVGEAAGTLAAYCIKWHTSPERVLINSRKVKTIQNTLVKKGTPVFWFSDVPTNHPNFAAIQYVSGTGVVPFDEEDLAFRPDAIATRGEAAEIFATLATKMQSQKHAALSPRQAKLEDNEIATEITKQDSAIATCIAHGLMRMKADGMFHADDELSPDDVSQEECMRIFHRPFLVANTTATRAALAVWAYDVVTSKRML